MVAGAALRFFTTVVLHSGGDFGMHVPAIVILVAVLSAYIVSAADDFRDGNARAEGRDAPKTRTIRWRRVALILAAGVFVGTGLLFVCPRSYHWQRVHRYLMAGLNRGANLDLPQQERQERRIEFLKTAVALGPRPGHLRKWNWPVPIMKRKFGHQNRLRRNSIDRRVRGSLSGISVLDWFPPGASRIRCKNPPDRGPLARLRRRPRG